MSELYNILLTIMNVLIIPILPVLASFIIAYLKKKTSQLETNSNNQMLNRYVEITENAIISSVAAVNQIYVDDLKEANGSLSPEQQKTAFQMAKGKVLSTIGNAGIEVLSQIYKDFEAYLNNRIEYYVNVLKNT